MDILKHTLSKTERLNSKNSITTLFSQGHSFVVYPYRVVFSELDDKQQAHAAILVSVPKKKFKRAVKRNLIRRRIKESYRLNKHNLLDTLQNENKQIGIAFIYLDKEVREYNNLNTKMREVLQLLINKVS